MTSTSVPDPARSAPSIRNARRAVVALLALILGVLVATSPPRQVGDAGDYYAMALNLAAGHPPSLSNPDITRIREQFTRFGLVFPGLLPQFVERGRQDFTHFWLYSALAAPLVWIAERAGVHPAWAFTWLNIACLLAAAAVATPRLGVRATLLLFVSPILWWSDKVHVEAFLFALMVAGLVLVQERPRWGFALLGAATAQNPSIAIVLLLFAAASGWQQPNKIPAAHVAIAAMLGLLIASIHPLYFAVRLHTLTPLTVSTDRHWPAGNELLAVLSDPNIGLIPNAPVLCLAAAFAILVTLWRRPLLQWCVASAVSAVALLVVFSQTTNINHGGTRGMSRYGLMLVPLLVPWLREAATNGRPWLDRAFTTVVCLSAAWAIVDFHPKRPDETMVPTRLASALWSRFPAYDNPPAEIFAERLSPRHLEDPVLPTATPTCSKLLLLAGKWPVPCPPATVPDRCLREGQLCYANETPIGYDFVVLPPRKNLVHATPGRAWPDDPAARMRISRILKQLRWSELRRDPDAANGAYVRGSVGLRGIYVLQGPDRFCVFVGLSEPGAELRLRLPMPMDLTIVELQSGEEHSVPLPRDVSGLLRVPISEGKDLLLVAAQHRTW